MLLDTLLLLTELLKSTESFFSRVMLNVSNLIQLNPHSSAVPLESFNLKKQPHHTSIIQLVQTTTRLANLKQRV